MKKAKHCRLYQGFIRWAIYEETAKATIAIEQLADQLLVRPVQTENSFPDKFSFRH
jgi:hypothetical protein